MSKPDAAEAIGGGLYSGPWFTNSQWVYRHQTSVWHEPRFGYACELTPTSALSLRSTCCASSKSKTTKTGYRGGTTDRESSAGHLRRGTQSRRPAPRAGCAAIQLRSSPLDL